MSEMNLVSIELKQPPEFKGVSDELASTDSSSKKRFSDVIDEHYNKSVDKKAEGSDAVHGKKTHSKSHNDREIDVKAPKSTLEQKSQTDIDELKRHLAALEPKSANIVEDSSLKERSVKPPKNEHTLPVPLPTESDDTEVLTPKTPVVGSEDDLIKHSKKSPKDEHTLPVPPPVTIVSQEEEQVSRKVENADKSAIDLLTMLKNADKILSNTDKKVTDEVNTDLAGKPQIDIPEQKGQQALAGKASEEETQAAVLKSLKNEDKVVKTSLAVEDSRLDKVEKHESEVSKKSVNVAGESQPLKANNQSTLASNKQAKETGVNADAQRLVAEQQKAQQLESEFVPGNGDLEASEEGVIEAGKQSSPGGEQQNVQDKTQDTVKSTTGKIDNSANVIVQQNLAMKAELNQVVDEVADKSQPVQPNVITSQVSQVKTNGKSVNEFDGKSVKIDDIADNEPSENASSEEVVNNKPDKALAEKAALTTAHNQNIGVSVPRSILGELDTQSGYEEKFDHTINQLTNTTVQSQKSITAMQTETISIYRKDFADQVKDKVMVMINQKIQQVDIQLDPPEMGNVHVRVNLQNEQAAVQFVVQNQQAKDALEQNMGRLRDMLAESGVDVGDANIEQGDSDQQENMASAGQGMANGGNEADELERANSDAQVAHLVKGSSTGVDYYA